mmetsp:Transcript_16107/g.27178  ORF Transcript_16107/g.27178 Transcript_16107/m.27178 type:complete len:260 (-) Transcript_16107:1202-1981(-)
MMKSAQPIIRILIFACTAKYSLGFLRHLSMRVFSTARAFSSGQSVADLRKDYSRKGISDDDPNIQKGPFSFFKSWFDEACAADILEPNAMCLSTCKDNVPSARIVLMKAYDEKGFVWYTNYNSRKGEELTENPRASLTFWWGALERSVRIEGRVEKVSDTESDAYFNSRPRGSQIGAWTSNQSNEIANRCELEAQEQAIQDKYRDDSVPVPRPPHWGGYRLIPSRMEFWKGRTSRLHDRIAFEILDSEMKEWSFKRLQP